MAIRILSSENITGKLSIYKTAFGGDTAGSGGTLDFGVGSTKYWQFRLDSSSSGDLAIDKTYASVWSTPVTIQRTSGNVGIGTISPAEKLEVVGSGGNTNIRVYDSSANSEVGIKLQGDAKTWTLQNWGSGGDNLRLLNNAGNIVQLWDDNGNVMIGNANDPEKKLHILTSTTDDTPQVLIQNGSSGDASLTFNVSGQSYVIGIDHDDSSKFKIAASGNLGTNDRVTLLSSGNVGIGTITPTTLLNTLVTANSENMTLGSAAYMGFKVGNTSTNLYGICMGVGDSGKGWIQVGRTDGTAIAYDLSLQASGGNVGIGTTSPAQKVHLLNGGFAYMRFTSQSYGATGFDIGQHTNGTIYLNNRDNTDMVFMTNNAERARISSLGNVGIGLTNPTAKLQVVSGDEQLTNFSGNVTDRLAYSRINSFASTSGTITGAAALELVGKANGSGHGRHAWIGAEGTSNTNFLTKLKFKIRGETNNGYAWAGSSEAPTIMTLEGDGNVGIGTTSPSALLDISSGTTTDVIRFGANSRWGFSRANNDNRYLSFMRNQNGSGTAVWTVDGDNGNVGINVTDPSAVLDIYSPYDVTSNPNSTGIRLRRVAGGNQSFLLGMGVSGVSNNYFAIRDITNSAYRFVINDSGNVAIGTTTSSNKLFVANGSIAINNSHSFMVGGDNDSAVGRLKNTAGVFNLEGDGTRSIRFGSGTNGEVVRIDNTNKRVGIGTTSPSADLHIQNASTATLKVITTGVADASVNIQGYDAGVHIGDATNGLRWAIWNDGPSTSSSLKFGSYALGTWYNDSSQVVTMTSDGKVGIGTVSPSSLLHIQGSTYNRVQTYFDGDYTSGFKFSDLNGGIWYDAGADDLILNSGHANSQMIFNTGGSESVRIDKDGRLGIGITNPSEKLHVNGRTILQNTEHSDYATGSINTTGVVVATVPSSTNGQSVMITFEATGGTGSVYSVIYSCYNGGGNWYYTKNVLIFGGNIEVAETNGSGSSTLSFSFRSTSGSAAYTPRVIMKGSPYGLVSFI